MRKKRNVLAGLLAVCLVFALMPYQALAGEGTEGQPETATAEENAEGQPETLAAEENAEGQPETLAAEENAEGQPETVTAEENAEDLPETLAADEEQDTDGETGEKGGMESDDPGRGRYSGHASPGFYGPVSRVVNEDIQHDARFNGYILQEGIDVSEWNGDINWAKVKEAGYDFAIIRVAGTWSRASGGQFMDNKAIQNIEGALNAGLSIGVYFFSQAITEREATKEAQYILNAIQPYKSRITLPVVFDFEYVSGPDGEGGRLYDAGLTKTKATKVCNKFCETVEAAGYASMVYSNLNMLGNHLNPSSLTGPVWLAQWTDAATYTGDYEFWQYSTVGTVPGISGYVDLNFRYVQKGPLTIAATSVGSIRLEWQPVRGASGYHIYRKTGGGDYVPVGSVSGGEVVSYSDKNLADATTYTYRVRSYTDTEAGTLNGFYTKTATGTTKVKGTVLRGEAGAFDTICLSWDQVSSASGYQLQRYDSSKKAYRTVRTISGKSKTSYTDKSLNAGKKYKYRIRACKNVGSKKVYSAWSKVLGVETSGNVKGTVNASYVSIRSGPGKSYRSLRVAGKNKVLKVTGSSGKWYRVSVKVNGKTKNGYISKSYLKLNMSSLKPVLQASAKSSAEISLTWYTVPDASGYQIQRYSPPEKAYRTVKTLGRLRTSCTNGGLKAGTEYKYRIRAYQKVNGKKVYSRWSVSRSAKTGGI